MCVVYLELFFQRETSLQTVLHKLLCDWKLVRNFCAFPDDHWITAIQELVSKHEVFLPMLHHILCARHTSSKIMFLVNIYLKILLPYINYTHSYLKHEFCSSLKMSLRTIWNISLNYKEYII